jgi:hypothetical protein
MKTKVSADRRKLLKLQADYDELMRNDGTMLAMIFAQLVGCIADAALVKQARYDGRHVLNLAKQVREHTAAMKAALAPLAEIARIHRLYEGPPCNNQRHSDNDEIHHSGHGDERVTITLGQCRAAAKLIGVKH